VYLVAATVVHFADYSAQPALAVKFKNQIKLNYTTSGKILLQLQTAEDISFILSHYKQTLYHSFRRAILSTSSVRDWTKQVAPSTLDNWWNKSQISDVCTLHTHYTNTTV